MPKPLHPMPLIKPTLRAQNGKKSLDQNGLAILAIIRTMLVQNHDEQLINKHPENESFFNDIYNNGNEYLRNLAAIITIPTLYNC